MRQILDRRPLVQEGSRVVSMPATNRIAALLEAEGPLAICRCEAVEQIDAEYSTVEGEISAFLISEGLAGSAVARAHRAQCHSRRGRHGTAEPRPASIVRQEIDRRPEKCLSVTLPPSSG